MQDTKLYERILGVEEPWRVERVELDLENGEVRVHLEHERGVAWKCPTCARACALHDHQAERRWRHLDTCQLQTIVHARPPRVLCEEHGVQAARLFWAEPRSRFTLLFECLAIDWLRAASEAAVAKRLGLTWDEVHAIKKRAVARGLARRSAEPIRYLGVDEKAFTKGQKYVTVVSDLEGSRVLYIAEDRRQTSLDGFWETLTDGQKGGVEAVAMDMWEPYVSSVAQNLPDGKTKIVFDKFHIASHLGEAVDKVRRAENRALLRDGNRTLVGTKYDWLRNPDSFDARGWREFRQLRTSNLKTARAWALKEHAMSLFAYQREVPARKYFKWWHNWATHSRLEPFTKVARMLKRRLDNVLTYLRHPITNAGAESLNAKIQWVKYTARGYRNLSNFITAIYFHCGGLNLYPEPHPSH